MRIMLCGEYFLSAGELMQALLPADEVRHWPYDRIDGMLASVDVIIPLMFRLDERLLARTSAGLVQQFGVGLEGVDIAAATARGIMVCNIPADVTPNADSTAEHAVFLMFALARRAHELQSAFRKGIWGGPIVQGLSGSTALVVGLGNVGKALASKLNGLGVKVMAVRRTPNPLIEHELNLIEAGDTSRLQDMASRADFVISTVSLNDRTRGLLDSSVFVAMKPSGYLINVSRGPVVEEADLVEALQRGTIAGAGLDVFSTEPVDPSNPLLAMENVFATPHVAGVTRQNYDVMSRVAAENINRFRRGETPLYCVNRETSP
ncbi:MAG: 2-hydroxyacid dehydrogenase [Thermodesulfobacteriota bacterium]